MVLGCFVSYICVKLTGNTGHNDPAELNCPPQWLTNYSDLLVIKIFIPHNITYITNFNLVCNKIYKEFRQSAPLNVEGGRVGGREVTQILK